MAKSAVAMTDAEISSFVADRDLAIVAAPDGKDGLVVGVAAYRADGGDKLTLDDRTLPEASGVCALVDTYPSYDRIQGVILHGRLERNGAAVLRIERASGFDFSKIARP